MKQTNLKKKIVVLVESYIQKSSAFAFEALKPAKPTV